MPTINIQSSLFDTILNLVLIFALLSLLASSLVELVNNYYKRRQQMLYNTISSMFDDGINVNFGQLLYNHPSILSLRKDDKSLPQYLHEDTFTDALIDKVCEYGTVLTYDETLQKFVPQQTDAGNILGYFEQGVNKMLATPLKLMLTNIILKAKEHPNSYDALRSQIITVFNNQMERTTGWYKADSRKLLRKVSFIVALCFNVNCFYLFTTLYNNPQLNAKLIPIAETLVNSSKSVEINNAPLLDSLRKAYFKNPKDLIVKQQYDTLVKITQDSVKSNITQYLNLLDSTKKLGLPLGWDKHIPPKSITSELVTTFDLKKSKTWDLILDLIVYLISLIISSFIISAGSPFWFEILVKLVNVRRAGIKPTIKDK